MDENEKAAEGQLDLTDYGIYLQTVTPTAEPKAPQPTAKTETPTAPTTRKRGRPPKTAENAKKGTKTRIINIAVDLDTYDKMQAAKAYFGDNMTAYINSLIAADLKANGRKYKKYLLDLAKRLGAGEK